MATVISKQMREAIDTAFNRMLQMFGVKHDIVSFSDLLNGAVETGDSSASPGNATISLKAGSSAIAAAATTCVITNTLAAVGDTLNLTLLDHDTTLTRLKYSMANGSFTVTGNASATATTKFTWQLIKKA